MGFFGRKTEFSGDMSVDPAMVRQWEEAAQISGKPLHIPGGANPTSYMAARLKEGEKERKEFLKRIVKEYDDMKEKGEKPDKKEAEKRARTYMKKKFRWK